MTKLHFNSQSDRMEADARDGQIDVSFFVPPSITRGDVLKPLLFTAGTEQTKFLFFGRYRQEMDRAEFVLVSHDSRPYLVSFVDVNENCNVSCWSLMHRGETVVVGLEGEEGQSVDLGTITGDELHVHLPDTAFASSKKIPIPLNMLVRPGVIRSPRDTEDDRHANDYVNAWTIGHMGDGKDDFECRLRIDVLTSGRTSRSILKEMQAGESRMSNQPGESRKFASTVSSDPFPYPSRLGLGG